MLFYEHHCQEFIFFESSKTSSNSECLTATGGCRGHAKDIIISAEATHFYFQRDGRCRNFSFSVTDVAGFFFQRDGRCRTFFFQRDGTLPNFVFQRDGRCRFFFILTDVA
jgi:hypothetical protein